MGHTGVVPRPGHRGKLPAARITEVRWGTPCSGNGAGRGVGGSGASRGGARGRGRGDDGAGAAGGARAGVGGAAAAGRGRRRADRPAAEASGAPGRAGPRPADEGGGPVRRRRPRQGGLRAAARPGAGRPGGRRGGGRARARRRGAVRAAAARGRPPGGRGVGGGPTRRRRRRPAGGARRSGRAGRADAGRARPLLGRGQVDRLGEALWAACSASMVADVSPVAPTRCPAWMPSLAQHCSYAAHPPIHHSHFAGEARPTHPYQQRVLHKCWS